MDCARCMSVRKAKRRKNYPALNQKWKTPPELLTPTEALPRLKLRDGSEVALYWRSRPRHGKMPDERVVSPERVSALEKAFRGFADRGANAVVLPSVGLTFDSIGEAYDFYNLYSWEVGFGIRYGKSRSNVKGTRSMQELLCVCSGKPKNENTTSSRCQCPALVRLLRTDDQGWFICEYRGTHNHRLLSTCAEKLHFPSHRHIDKYTRELVAQLRANNVNLSKVYSIIGTFFGKLENVPFTKRCLKTLCGKISQEQADDDVKKTMEMFSELKASDSEFTYQVQVDDESRIRTLIWSNGRSKLQYHHFGDVVTFDTTYKTNLYDMPFGLFVGVNNHFQSVIYAGVLMRDETVQSFEWVFREFVRLMGGKKPITILTDRARAMEIAISSVMPDATHRWCKWHVLRKAKESLGTHYSKKSNFRLDFHNLVDEMLTVEEFEAGWKEIMERYGLTANTFLIQAYEVRHKWAKPYFSGKFCAKQTSTQRSESANHMLKSYVPPACPMNIFVKQYGKLQYDREQEEGFQEKRTRLGGAVIKSNLPIERHASKVYTRTMFEMFGRVLFVAGSYEVEEVEHKKKYVAAHINPDAMKDWYKKRFAVEVHDDCSYFVCECGRFEHMGMICCHILKVMIFLRIRAIPPLHIVKRWTVDARDILPDHIKHYQKDMGPPEASTFRHSAMYITALELVHMGDSNPDSFECVMTGLCELKAKAASLCESKDGKSMVEKSKEASGSITASLDSMQSRLSSKKATVVTSRKSVQACSGDGSFVQGGCSAIVQEDNAEVSSTLGGGVLLPPERRLKRGHPSTARDKPPYETSGKRSRFCSICRGKGHKSTTCPDEGDTPVKPRKEARCGNCGITGHRKTSCSKPLFSSVAGIAHMTG
ncbi:protein FAR1-RELATED SEQUENCE 7-like [Lolium rigidum]|uniref:protein FAR1-RELATED SEQUENCE 7-like n=1 Tax=Lolium rigidum TaxID=89674 RepID=UPI001F5D9CE8|nr:protein FAR1-RELATED SEQUENCE 7-like [Lolium rigidum]